MINILTHLKGNETFRTRKWKIEKVIDSNL